MVGTLVENCTQCCSQWTVIPSAMERREENDQGKFSRGSLESVKDIPDRKSSLGKGMEAGTSCGVQGLTKGLVGLAQGCVVGPAQHRGRRLTRSLSQILRGLIWPAKELGLPPPFFFFLNNQAYIVFLHRYTVSGCSLLSKLHLSEPAPNTSASLDLGPSGKTS